MDTFYYHSEIEYIVEVLKNHVYFAVLQGNTNRILRNTPDTIYFSVDEELIYVNYYFDFGPLNLSCLYKYCRKLNSYLCTPDIKRIVHYTTSEPSKRSNAAFLMGAFAVLYLKMEPKDIYRTLLSAGGAFRDFVDASQGLSAYTIKLIDCLHAINKASILNFFNFADFNVVEYDTYDKLQNGDMNWLVPRKFLAFIGPNDNELLSGHTPGFYFKYFIKSDIRTVIRLNNKTYDASVFNQVGIEHHDLFFPDGTTPPKEILLKFLNIAETAPAAIAVHCKAGLGRTGSLIGAYIIKHYRMTAREAIAWMRICRPGSVIGQQQGWLEKIESWLWRQGSQYRIHLYGDGDRIPYHRYGVYSIEWPKERERLCKIAERKRYELAMKKSSNTLEPPILQAQKRSFSANESSRINRTDYEKKKLPYNRKEEDFKRITKLLSRTKPNVCYNTGGLDHEDMNVVAVARNGDFTYNQSPSHSLDSKKRISKNIQVRESHINRPLMDNYIGRNMQMIGNENYNNKCSAFHRKNEVQTCTTNYLSENSGTQRNFVTSTESTQGDKLNEIKAKRNLSNSAPYNGNNYESRSRRQNSDMVKRQHNFFGRSHL